MFIVKIDNLESLLKLCSVTTGTDYVDVYLSKKSATFVTDTTEFFCCYSTQLLQSDGDLSFRLKRVYLQQLTVEGYLYFNKQGNDIVMSIVNENQIALYSVTFKSQIVFNSVYEHKLSLIAGMSSAKVWDMSQFRFLNKIAKASNSVINIEKGIASVNVVGHNMVYVKTPINDTFAISSFALTSLSRISNKMFFVENYIGVAEGNIFALATKSRSYDNSVAIFAEEAKSRCKCSINLNSLMHVASKLKTDIDLYTIDLKKGNCTLSIGEDLLEVPVTVSNFQATSETGDFTIVFSQDMLKSVIYYCNTLDFDVKFKKGFITLENELFSVIM